MKSLPCLRTFGGCVQSVIEFSRVAGKDEMSRLLIVVMVLGLAGCGPGEKAAKLWEIKSYAFGVGNPVIRTFKHRTTGTCLVRVGTGSVIEVPTAVCEEE